MFGVTCTGASISNLFLQVSHGPSVRWLLESSQTLGFLYSKDGRHLGRVGHVV